MAGQPLQRLESWLDAGQVSRAEKLALAWGFAVALDEGGGAEDVPSAGPPARLLRRLPLGRGSYLRIVSAAARAYAQLGAMAGDSQPMREVRRTTWTACFGDSLHQVPQLERVIRDHDVLILGETGTGKEGIAQVIRQGTLGGEDGDPAPFAAVNAAAVPETLIESELFGHVKGAFTGASAARGGRIKTAHGGCFFLDEVGDLRTTTQVKLLRVMETNEVQPLGSDSSQDADVRWVAATHRDLAAMVEQDDFRRDLFQRLAGTVLRLPPLRERPEDIPAIGRSFLERYLGETQLPHLANISRWLEGAEARRHDWAGNIRELQNALRNQLLGLPPGLLGEVTRAQPPPDWVPPSIAGNRASLDEVRGWYVRRVLASVEGNLSAAARVLEVDRVTARRIARA